MSASPARLEPPAPEPVQLAELLKAAAAELTDLSRAGDRLHGLVERRMAAAPLAEGGIEDAQLIDFLVQHLETVGLFLRLLAAEAPATDIDYARLSARLPLADLASRLGGGAAPPPAASGDLDLF